MYVGSEWLPPADRSIHLPVIYARQLVQVGGERTSTVYGSALTLGSISTGTRE